MFEPDGEVDPLLFGVSRSRFDELTVANQKRFEDEARSELRKIDSIDPLQSSPVDRNYEEEINEIKIQLRALKSAFKVLLEQSYEINNIVQRFNVRVFSKSTKSRGQGLFDFPIASVQELRLFDHRLRYNANVKMKLKAHLRLLMEKKELPEIVRHIFEENFIVQCSIRNRTKPVSLVDFQIFNVLCDLYARGSYEVSIFEKDLTQILKKIRARILKAKWSRRERLTPNP